MRNLKKFLALVLAMMMVFSLMVTVSAADATKYKAEYKALENYGVFIGAGTVGNDALDMNYSRAQMATVLYRLMTGDTEGNLAASFSDYAAAAFEDVNSTDWHAGYIGWCYNAGIIIGVGGDMCAPDADVTGFSAALMLLRALGYDGYKEITNSTSGWEYTVGVESARYGILGIVNVGQLTGAASRGLAAYLTYRAATIPSMVEKAGNGVYTSTNTKLITVKTDEGYDDFGAPSTIYNVTFNWVKEDPVTREKAIPDEPLAAFYGPVSQCDVSDATKGVIKDAILDTYTNGIGNKGTQRILDTNTTAMLGAQGRETLVYADRIVYKDVVLVESDGASAGYVDTAGHTITAIDMTSDAIVYYNESMEGISNNAAAPFVKEYATLADTAGIYTVSGNHKRGTMLMGNILTFTESNNVDTGNRPYETEDDQYSSEDDVVRIQNAQTISAAKIKIKAITRSNNSDNIIGFVDSSNREYLYSVSYSYNTILGDPDYLDETVLTARAIDKEFMVYVYTAPDGSRNVLGIEPIADEDGQFGVVTDLKRVDVDYKADTSKMYGVQYTVLMADKTTKTFKTLNPEDNLPFNAVDYSDPDKNVSLMRHLVYITPDTAAASKGLTGYYVLTPATDDLINSDPDAVFYAGDADTVDDGSIIVNDDTVFFVAEYKQSNKLASATGIDAYAFQNYSVYKGFKTLPDDLSYKTGDEVYDDGVQLGVDYNLDAEDNPVEDLDVYAFDADGNPLVGGDGTKAAYVLILNGTHDTPIKSRAQATADYAYVLYGSKDQKQFDEYYRFSIIKNGSASTLDVSNASGELITDAGLYIYETEESGKGAKKTNSFQPDDAPVAVNFVSDTWSYSKGVLTVDTDMTAINNIDASDIHDSWNVTYLTVVDNVPIYIVNNSTGNFVKTNYTLSELNSSSLYGPNVDFYFQVNQYGWITLVYMMDTNAGTGNAKTPDTSVVIDFKNGVPSALDDVPTTVAGARNLFTLTGATNAKISGISSWKYVKSDGISWTTATGEIVFQSGYTYRVTLTLSGAKLSSAPLSADTNESEIEIIDWTATTVTLDITIS